MGFAPLSESSIRTVKGKSETKTLSALNKILSSTIGGALATWNQPIEVQVETQAAKKDKVVTVKPAVRNTLNGIYAKDGVKVFIVVLPLVLGQHTTRTVYG